MFISIHHKTFMIFHFKNTCIHSYDVSGHLWICCKMISCWKSGMLEQSGLHTKHPPNAISPNMSTQYSVAIRYALFILSLLTLINTSLITYPLNTHLSYIDTNDSKKKKTSVLIKMSPRYTVLCNKYDLSFCPINIYFLSCWLHMWN